MYSLLWACVFVSDIDISLSLVFSGVGSMSHLRKVIDSYSLGCIDVLCGVMPFGKISISKDLH